MKKFKAFITYSFVTTFIFGNISALASKPAISPECPAANLLDAVMVNNEKMANKSLRFSDGTEWDIEYTYSIYGATRPWGVSGQLEKLKSSEKPVINLAEKEDWEFYGTEEATGNEVWRFTCDYDVLSPRSTLQARNAPTAYDPIWKFSLYLQKVVVLTSAKNQKNKRGLANSVKNPNQFDWGF